METKHLSYVFLSSSKGLKHLLVWLCYVFQFTQASPDNKALGDCPFTQRANLALKLKGIKNVTMILLDLTNKPEWYKGINAAGTVPTLEFDDKVITDSYEMIKYLDETYPDPPLEPCNNKEAEEVTGTCMH